MNKACRSLVVAAALFTLPLSATAQTITLRVADSFPSGHVFHRVLILPFIEEVERETKGQVKFQHFPGEQLGRARDMLTLTQTGVVDVGSIIPDYFSDKTPLTAAMGLPGAFPEYCHGSRALWTLMTDGGFLNKNEFEPNKIVPIITWTLPAYQLVFTTSRSINSLSDMKGLKVRSSGGAMDFVLKNLDVVPVRLTPPEIFEALSRGTVDAAIFPYNSANTYGFTQLIKSGTVDKNFGTVPAAYSISQSKWQQIPDNIKAIMRKAGEKISHQACQQFLSTENKALEATKAKGMKPVVFSPADEKKLNEEFEKAARDWAASLDSRGRPGTDALAAVKKALDATK